MNQKNEQKPVRKKTITGAIIINKKKEILIARRTGEDDILG